MDCDDASLMMMDGQALEVTRMMDAAPAPLDSCARLAMACAYAIVGEANPAREMIESTPLAEDDDTANALLYTCLGYLALHDGDMDGFTANMKEATAKKSHTPLPWYSLGLHSLWRERDFASARRYLEMAATLAPRSGAARVALVSLEAEEGNPRKARILLRDEIARRRLSKTKLGTLVILLTLASTPGGGGVLALLLAGAEFLPYIGLPLLVGLLGFSAVTFFTLKTITPRLAVLPAIFSVAWVAALFCRFLVFGKTFP